MKKIVFILIINLPQLMWSQQIIEKEIIDWEFRMVGDSVWKPAKVPGTIIDNFVDLSDVSNPLHPYYGDNEKLYQWIGEEDWEFRTTIIIDKDLLYQDYTYNLEFGCLDLFATVYLDEIEQYSIQNAFMPIKLEGLTDEQINVRIVFHSTSRITKLMMQNDSLNYPGGERVYARTAQYQFGWDWGPKFVNMGIRKPVKLIMHSPDGINFSSYISNLQIEKGDAYFLLNFNIESKLKDFRLYYTLNLNGKMLEQWDLPINIPGNKTEDYRYWVIKDPKQWWPNGMGEPNYYTFDLRLTLPEDTNTIAKTSFNLTFCDIQLEQKKDKKGESFYFTVNGEKVFAKGANYVPDDSFNPGKNTKELIKLAHDANMNMLRVWGGGTYPDDDFYIECMKNGIMVWQDFMYACAMYPFNDDFNYSCLEEAYYQTDRLNYFNNVAVWCGNNENEEGWQNWGWQKQLNITPKDSSYIWKGYSGLFNYDLRYAFDTAQVDYISTSPKHGWGRKESMTEGDSHYWGVWWGLEPLEKYNEKVPRFMSEFGMQGMPDLSTLQKVIPDSAMNFDSPKFKNHQKHPTGFKTLDHYLKEYLVIPDSMEDYAYATQILQAYALTIAVEAQRRAMPYCMGSLIWQLNDCWPVTSWSLIDSELKKKIAYDEVTKAFKPTIISVQEEKDNYSIYIVNEDKRISNSFIQILILDFYGNTKFRKKISVSAPANSSKVYFKLSKKIVSKWDNASIYMDIQLIKKASSKSDNRLIPIGSTQYHFVRLNQLKLPASDIHIEKNDGVYWFRSKTYCPYVFISQEGNEEDIYLGTVGPRNEFGFESEHNEIPWIENLILDPKGIKCLNTLLLKK